MRGEFSSLVSAKVSPTVTKSSQLTSTQQNLLLELRSCQGGVDNSAFFQCKSDSIIVQILAVSDHQSSRIYPQATDLIPTRWPNNNQELLGDKLTLLSVFDDSVTSSYTGTNKIRPAFAWNEVGSLLGRGRFGGGRLLLGGVLAEPQDYLFTRQNGADRLLNLGYLTSNPDSFVAQ